MITGKGSALYFDADSVYNRAFAVDSIGSSNSNLVFVRSSFMLELS
jgi:hypothetical protein